jgi:hypothetical protein
VIDILILTKNEDGVVEATEFSDVGELADLLAEEDVEHLAAAMEPGSTAGVLIWENLWAAPFASAARRSGGQLIANGRIPIQSRCPCGGRRVGVKTGSNGAKSVCFPVRRSSPLSRPMKRLRPKETDDAPPTSTRRRSWCHRRAGGENRGRGQGGLTRPLAGREDRGRGRGRYTWAGAPTPNLAPGWCRGDGDAKAIPSAGDPLLAPARVLASMRSTNARISSSSEPPRVHRRLGCLSPEVWWTRHPT